MQDAVEKLLTPGTCLKRIGSVRTYRIVESVDGPYVHVRKPNGVRDRLSVDGLLDMWDVGIDSRFEENAFVRDIVTGHGDALALARDMLEFMNSLALDTDDAARVSELADRLDALLGCAKFSSRRAAECDTVLTCKIEGR